LSSIFLRLLVLPPTHTPTLFPTRRSSDLIGHFFNGCASRAERGLEMSTLAVVDVTHRCAFTLAVAQTPPGADATKAEQDETRVRSEKHTPELQPRFYLASVPLLDKKNYTQ